MRTMEIFTAVKKEWGSSLWTDMKPSPRYIVKRKKAKCWTVWLECCYSGGFFKDRDIYIHTFMHGGSLWRVDNLCNIWFCRGKKDLEAGNKLGRRLIVHCLLCACVTHSNWLVIIFLSLCWFLLPKKQTSWPDTRGCSWFDLSLCPFVSWHITPRTLLLKHTEIIPSPQNICFFTPQAPCICCFLCLQCPPCPCLIQAYSGLRPWTNLTPWLWLSWTSPKRANPRPSALTARWPGPCPGITGIAPGPEWACFWPIFKRRLLICSVPAGLQCLPARVHPMWMPISPKSGQHRVPQCGPGKEKAPWAP